MEDDRNDKIKLYDTLFSNQIKKYKLKNHYKEKLNEIYSQIDKLTIDEQIAILIKTANQLIKDEEIVRNYIDYCAHDYHFDFFKLPKESNGGEGILLFYKKNAEMELLIKSEIVKVGGYYQYFRLHKNLFYSMYQYKVPPQIKLDEWYINACAGDYAGNEFDDDLLDKTCSINCTGDIPPIINFFINIMDKIEGLEDKIVNAEKINNYSNIQQDIKFKPEREKIKYTDERINDIELCKIKGILNFTTIDDLVNGGKIDFLMNKHDIISLFDHWGYDSNNKIIIDNCLFKGNELKDYDSKNTRKNHSREHTKEFVEKYLT
jgi:hypothetical protein